jgi:hypothetical protein
MSTSTLNLKSVVQNVEGHPLHTIIDGITDELIKKYRHVSVADLTIVELIRESILTGITLAKTEVGDLF